MIEDMEEFVPALIKCICYIYNSNPAPSLIISYLPNKKYYVSVVKYNGSVDDREVIISETNESLNVALYHLAHCLLDLSSKTNPVTQLAQIMNRSQEDEEAYVDFPSVEDDPFYDGQR